MSMAAPKTMTAGTRTVGSDVLGPIRVTDDQVVEFPDGLLGFPETREYVLVPAGRKGTYWLQSVEHTSLIFLLVDPFLYFEDYEVELSAGEVRSLNAEAQSDVAVLTIVTLPGDDGEDPTANLQGPLALNLTTGLGRQVILRRPGLGVRRAFRLEDER